MRVKILASALPLILAGVVARGELAPGSRPCISLGGVTLQIATAPWQNQTHVSFTDDPRAATVRVQLVERPEIADFTVIDDVETADAESCGAGDEMKYVSVAPRASAGEPVIYLSNEPGADYRIFVRSHSFSAQDAAALIVGASKSAATLRTAAL